MISSRSAASARRSVRVQCSASDGQLVMLALGLLAVEQGSELAVDLEVGISADRRGEVAVVVAGQGVVALGLGGVDGLLQAPQQPVMDRVAPRASPAASARTALELEPALGLLDLEARGCGRTRRTRRASPARGRSVPGGGSRRAGSVRAVATASLAASMNSSITWWLSSCEARWAPATSPWSPRSISTSGMFSSSARARTAACGGSSPARASAPSIATTSGATPSGGSASGSFITAKACFVAEAVVDPDRRPGEPAGRCGCPRR